MEVSTEELNELMKREGPRPFRLIDVREEEEFNICRLEWAELIPLAMLAQEVPKRLIDKDKPVVVYCHHGLRSSYAAEYLRSQGYENVYNLTGGIDAWSDLVDPSVPRY